MYSHHKPAFSLHIDAENVSDVKMYPCELGCPAIVLDNGNVCIVDTKCVPAAVMQSGMPCSCYYRR